LCLSVSNRVFSFFGSRQPAFKRKACVYSTKKGADEGEEQNAFAVGTFIEFEEKTRIHAGKIAAVEHNARGSRYDVIDEEGKHFSIRDKAVTFAIGAPSSPAQEKKLYKLFLSAHHATEEELERKLELSHELLEMAWEEANASESLLTPASLVELLHAHAASAIEKYMAWKVLKTDTAHVFFKAIKEQGRIVSFEAKGRKAVENAKAAFCRSHPDSEICFV
jgi:hypothetical protein